MQNNLYPPLKEGTSKSPYIQVSSFLEPMWVTHKYCWTDLTDATLVSEDFTDETLAIDDTLGDDIRGGNLGDGYGGWQGGRWGDWRGD